MVNDQKLSELEDTVRRLQRECQENKSDLLAFAARFDFLQSELVALRETLEDRAHH